MNQNTNENSFENSNQNTNEITKFIRKGMNQVGIPYAVFLLFFLGFPLLARFILDRVMPDILKNHYIEATYLLTILTVDVFGLSLLYLLLRKQKVREKVDEKLGFGRWICFLFICYFLMLSGSFVGNIVEKMIGSSSGDDMNALLTGGHDFLRILSAGILAPIVEELTYRKFLIDRLGAYNKKLAIFVSGLFFGLMHGNFAQFFFACFIGWLFAFIYAETGRIRYSIIYHMIINMMTSAVAVKLLALNGGPDLLLLNIEKFTEHPVFDTSMLPMLLYLLYAMCLLGAALIGCIIFIVFLATGQFRLKQEPKGEIGQNVHERTDLAKAFFTSYGTWAFLVAAVLLFVVKF